MRSESKQRRVPPTPMASSGDPMLTAGWTVVVLILLILFFTE